MRHTLRLMILRGVHVRMMSVCSTQGSCLRGEHHLVSVLCALKATFCTGQGIVNWLPSLLTEHSSGLFDLQVYGQTSVGHAACICVHKKQLYDTVKALRMMGGSGVLVSPMTYIFDEEPQRWTDLLQKLELESDPLKNGAHKDAAYIH
jgi:hypothetical protein